MLAVSSPKMKLKTSSEIKTEILQKFFTKRYKLPGERSEFRPIEPAQSFNTPKSAVWKSKSSNKSFTGKVSLIPYVTVIIKAFI